MQKVSGILLLIMILLLNPVVALANEHSIQTVKVITLNLHDGKDSSGRSNFERFKELIATEKPDVIALQEVEKKHLKQLKFPGYQIVGGMNANLGFFRFGNVVMTRHQIVYYRHHYLPSKLEQRGLDEAAIAIDGRYFTIFNTHLGLGQPERAGQLAEINRIASLTNGPVLIVGDYNTRPKDSLFTGFNYNEIGDFTQLANSFPTRDPKHRIDLLWYSNHWEPRSAQVLAWDGSDHLPVQAELLLKEPLLTKPVPLEISDLSLEHNPLLPDIGTGRASLDLGISNGPRNHQLSWGKLSLKTGLLELSGKISKDENPIFSIGLTKIIDMRDYFSLWGVRGKAEWSFLAATSEEKDFWAEWHQYYRWSSRWGTRIIVSTNQTDPALHFEQTFLPRNNLSITLGGDTKGAALLKIAVTPGKNQSLGLSWQVTEDTENWGLAWRYSFTN